MGYPIILGGDHAAFEQEWDASGRPDNERPDWPLPSFDARDWAAHFCEIAKRHDLDIDEGWMLTWFANALMRGYDQRTSECVRGATLRARVYLAWQVLTGKSSVYL